MNKGRIAKGILIAIIFAIGFIWIARAVGTVVLASITAHQETEPLGQALAQLFGIGVAFLCLLGAFDAGMLAFSLFGPSRNRDGRIINLKIIAMALCITTLLLFYAFTIYLVAPSQSKFSLIYPAMGLIPNPIAESEHLTFVSAFLMGLMYLIPLNINCLILLIVQKVICKKVIQKAPSAES